MINYRELEFYRDKKVLVTGHTGFKGSYICKLLIMLGADVTGYSLEPPTEPALFNILKLSESMISIIGDIRDLSKLQSGFRVHIHRIRALYYRQSIRLGCTGS